jgi:hypothetical protein
VRLARAQFHFVLQLAQTQLCRQGREALGRPWIAGPFGTYGRIAIRQKHRTQVHLGANGNLDTLISP